MLLLCAGVELDATFAAACAAAQGDPRRTQPTFGLALAALPDAHWSALTPDGPLRRWRLVEPAPGEALTTGPLRIDERVLHYLAGVPTLDERLRGPRRGDTRRARSRRRTQALAERIGALWSPGGKPLPVVSSAAATAAGAARGRCAAPARSSGSRLLAFDAADCPRRRPSARRSRGSGSARRCSAGRRSSWSATTPTTQLAQRAAVASSRRLAAGGS